MTNLPHVCATDDVISHDVLMSYHMMFQTSLQYAGVYVTHDVNVLSIHTLQNILESLLNSDSIYDIIF